MSWTHSPTNNYHFHLFRVHLGLKTMYKKPTSPLYANVSDAKFKNQELTAQNEPTYYNTVTNIKAQPSKGIYSNVNYPSKSSNIYSNISETGKPTYKNTQYPLYDNLKPLGLLLTYYLCVECTLVFCYCYT